MGACYSCSGCGKCTSWLNGLRQTCLACKGDVSGHEERCPHCGRPLPPPPGVAARRGASTRVD